MPSAGSEQQALSPDEVVAPSSCHSRLGENPARKLNLNELVARVSSDHLELAFMESTHFAWHAGKKHVSFRGGAGINQEHAAWALLHELGHALLSHAGYRYDMELLQLEAAAWQKACELAPKYSLYIDEDYIQDCLDTYRDWLHLRATCPKCFARSLQASERRYRCLNCQTEWQVTRSRLCRPYRLQTA